MSYSPLKITGMQTGLVQEREEFILPNDAYPVLENAFVWRERIKRKQGYELLGRLRRVYTNFNVGGTLAGQVSIGFANVLTINLGIVGEPNATIEPGSVSITITAPDTSTFTDNGDGTFTVTGKGDASSVINYALNTMTINFNVPLTGGATFFLSLNYFPNLPVMGLRSRELTDINNEQLVAFDTKYAYIFGSTGWQEFISGITWTGNNSNFFWSTNYWVDALNNKLFWVTNDSGTIGDPIRYTNGTVWTNFTPQINVAGDLLNQCLAMLPFRSRLVVFNTLEGANLATSVSFSQRIRWAAIGNPLTATAWRDDIPGKGGFLDIPTAENIVAVGFVRDNLVIYCERSTWQLRYTGRSIAPFQIEKVNSELGAESTFSAVQFDTSLVGIGDKGVVECDSFKSDRIDVKIPDLVFQFSNDSNGPKRVHGIRDFQQRLAYWTYPYKPDEEPDDVFPNRRLVYNYENDSWAIFTDSLTTLGTYQAQSGRKWQDFIRPNIDTWGRQNTSWIDRPSLFPSIVGGNQQGFVEYLDSEVGNDVSLYIKNIIGFGITDSDPAAQIVSPNHNLETNQVIQIFDIPTGTTYDVLNDEIFSVNWIDIDTFSLLKFDSDTGEFSLPGQAPIGTYIGGGQISIRDNFSIKSKKFNFIDEGQNIQLGFVDVLFNSTSEGAISMNVYTDYNDSEPTNTLPLNENQSTNLPDTFFNSSVPTFSIIEFQSKTWQRVFCATRAAFITIEWTLSNAQMVGPEQESDVQIDAQILWVRKAGTQLTSGF